MSDKKPTPQMQTPPKKEAETADSAQKVEKTATEPLEKEINGYEAQGLPEPTRYGDWEVKGRCSDF